MRKLLSEELCLTFACVSLAFVLCELYQETTQTYACGINPADYGQCHNTMPVVSDSGEVVTIRVSDRHMRRSP